MKKIQLVLILWMVCGTGAAFAQSKSFDLLTNKFSGYNDVHIVNVNGFVARTVLWMAGESDINRAVRDLRDIRVITIPLKVFRTENVSVRGFKHVLKKKLFEELASKREHGEIITLYQDSTHDDHQRYMLIVEGDDDVVVVEMIGSVDPATLMKSKEF